MAKRKRNAEQAERNKFYESEMAKLQQGSVNVILASSNLKDVRLTIVLSALEEALECDNIAELKMRIESLLHTDTVLENTLRLQNPADLDRLNLLLRASTEQREQGGHARPVELGPDHLPPAPPPLPLSADQLKEQLAQLGEEVRNSRPPPLNITEEVPGTKHE